MPRHVPALFPYQSRSSQPEIMGSILDALETGSHIALESGTGTGKTISVLAPTVEYALEHDKRVLYLTHTNAQQRQVLLELREMKKKNSKVWGVGIQGRHGMCPLLAEMRDARDGTPEELSRLCSEKKRRTQEAFDDEEKKPACRFFHGVLAKGLEDIHSWMRKQVPTAEEVLEHCAERGICPYEASKAAMKYSPVVTAPYIYYFSPAIQLHLMEWLCCDPEDLIVVVDEAHNLPDFARELFSVTLSLSALRKAISEAEGEGDPSLLEGHPATRFLHLLTDILLILEDNFAGDEDGMVPTDELRLEVMDHLKVTSRSFDLIAENLVIHGEAVRSRKQALGRLPRSYMYHVGKFLSFWSHLEDDEYVKLVYRGENPWLEAYCLDPSTATGVINSVHASIHVSGTLEPLKEYRDSIGLPHATTLQNYPSPFPRENRLVLYLPDVTSRYEELARDPGMIPRMARYVKAACKATDRNTVVFFPSYAMMGHFMDLGVQYDIGRPFYSEAQKMGQNELMGLVKAFKREKGAVLFSVVGGRVSEGTDFPGRELELALMVGIPYPKPTAKQKAMQAYYDRKFNGLGWEYTVKAPTTRKVLQSIGRLIRSDADRGVAIILDRRALHFRQQFPGMVETVEPVRAITEFFS